MGKEISTWRVKMAVWKQDDQGCYWSRRDIHVLATSRHDAIQKAAQVLGHKMMKPASGSKGRYFLARCRDGRNCVLRALSPAQVRAYIKNVSGSFPKFPTHSITATPDRSSAERKAAGLPAPVHSLPLPLWECPHCGQEDGDRHLSDGDDEPCQYCGVRPHSDDEFIREIFSAPQDAAP